ncbi:MAG: NADH-quinone oxidoreductase subunit H [Candidatus Omnitrophica bacterium]|nr:NADH-quinone oxidoreductase subunit H [Candidatus Omnitrophota bacterium]
MLEQLAIKTALSVIMVAFVMSIAGLLTWVERKQSAVMQDRVGANRASIFGFRILGLFHPIADVIKMVMKEDFTPSGAQRFLFTLAPVVSVTFAIAAVAAIPFGPELQAFGRTISLQVAQLDIGLLYIFAMMSLGVYGVILAGISSNNNYAFLGGLRGASQMLSYEITLGVAILGAVMVYSTLDLQGMVMAQGKHLWGLIPMWGIIVQPVGALLFMTAALAETKRIPFDLPEGESEIVGYFVEYSGMKFGMFFMTDFIETILVAMIMTTVFFGGWQVPWLFADGIHWPWGGVVAMSHGVVVGLQVLSFVFKVVAFIWFFMIIRWTLPRFRYDQLMRLGWKYMFPVSLANIVITGLVLVLIG